MNPHVILLFHEGDIETIEDAKKIGDEKDTYTELIRKNRAAAIPEPTEVRLLDTMRVICFAFRTLQVPCSDVPTTLEGLYGEARVPVDNLTSADSKKRHDGLVEMFTKHDLSGFVADEYALVRVVSGKQSGTKGWVRMTKLRRLAPKSRP
jgi:hypothetical protein